MDRRQFLIAAAAVPMFDVFGDTKSTDVGTELFDVFGDKAAAESTKPVGTIETFVWERGCTYCNKLKEDIKGYTGLKFEFHTTSGEAPVLKWKVRGKQHEQKGWQGLDSFVKAYNASLKSMPVAVQQQVYAIYYNRHRHGGHWTFPGELHQHLCHSHGYCHTSNWSEEKCLRTHDWAHS